MDGSRLIADIQQWKANDPKRPFKVTLVSARSSALRSLGTSRGNVSDAPQICHSLVVAQ